MRPIKKTLIGASILAFSLGMLATNAQAEYPEDKTVRIIIPFGPGGTTDVVFRTILPYLEKTLGQTAIIVNIKGAGGAVGTQAAIDAKPDGYTIGTLQTNTLIAQAVGLGSYANADYVPAVSIGFMPLTLAVKGDSPYKNLSDYQAAAKKAPGEIGLSMGVGTLAHFVAIKTEQALGVDLKLINAGGGAKKKASVLGGHSAGMIDPPPGVLGLHRSGDLRVLAVFGPDRLSSMPDVPTATEQGVDLNAFQMKGFFLPKGTPAAVIDTLASAVCALGDNQEMRKKLDELSVIWRCESGDKLMQWVGEERANVNAIAKSLGY
ncbi:MAG: tripartite tricarboxylate transporter substrate binding protein [Oceanospirillaceae bacterium]|nr:tripartite tricarboxylate transporter substrate binding protein [Oceanospirillaceae bacterium]